MDIYSARNQNKSHHLTEMTKKNQTDVWHLKHKEKTAGSVMPDIQINGYREKSNAKFSLNWDENNITVILKMSFAFDVLFCFGLFIYIYCYS